MRITGKNGQVKLGGVVVGTIDDWTIDAKIPVADVTVMQDPFKVKASLIREWAATLKVKWDNTLSSVYNLFDTSFTLATTSGGAQSGKVALEFWTDAAGSEKYAGDAFLDFGIKVPVGGAVEASVKATGTGSLVRTP